LKINVPQNFIFLFWKIWGTLHVDSQNCLSFNHRVTKTSLRDFGIEMSELIFVKNYWMPNHHITSQDQLFGRSTNLALKNSWMTKLRSHIEFISWDTWNSLVETRGTNFRHLSLHHFPIYGWHITPFLMWHVSDMTLDFHVRSVGSAIREVLLQNKHRSLKSQRDEVPKSRRNMVSIGCQYVALVSGHVGYVINYFRWYVSLSLMWTCQRQWSHVDMLDLGDHHSKIFQFRATQKLSNLEELESRTLEVFNGKNVLISDQLAIIMN
jgi:hypothetical protein